MSLTYQQKIARWQQLPTIPIKEIFVCGLEREGIRVNQQATSVQTPHPESLGSSLTNKYITTDFAEALLEIVTPPCNDVNDLMSWMNDLHSFVDANINEELIWSSSMPPILPDPDNIKIAEYGNSYQGRVRHIYRRGLGLRYGRRMQAIAGIHLNLSFGDKFLEYYNQISETDICASSVYFNLLRNYIRNGWLINYLFGASPALDTSFLQGMETPSFLQSFAERSYYHPHSTCLRMGSMGYNNRKHSSLNVCFNNLEEYISTIKKLLKKPEEEYQKHGIKDDDGYYQQLNTNILQIENEYYAAIRPKAVRRPDEKTIDVLMEKGVEYVEIRNLDINPFLPCGIDEHQIRFMQLFLLYTSIADSPAITSEECQDIRNMDGEIIRHNINNDKDFKFTGGKILNINDDTNRMLIDMEPLAQLLDESAQSSAYSDVLQLQKDRVEEEHRLPAIQQMYFLRNERLDFVEGMMKFSEGHKSFYSKHYKNNKRQVELTNEAATSLQKEKDLVKNQKGEFNDFLADYLNMKDNGI